MARPREPIDLIIAKGKKHLTKEETETRRKQEVSVPFNDIKAPAFLTGKKKLDEFYYYADRLTTVGIFTELDVDTLARYIQAKELYSIYTKQLEKVIKKGNVVNKWKVIDELRDKCNADDAELSDLTELLEVLIRKQRGNDVSTIMTLQGKAFKQCLACARELGLTISSRAKLIMPVQEVDDDDEL